MLGNNEMKAFCEGLNNVVNNYDAVVVYASLFFSNPSNFTNSNIGTGTHIALSGNYGFSQGGSGNGLILPNSGGIYMRNVPAAYKPKKKPKEHDETDEKVEMDKVDSGYEEYRAKKLNSDMHAKNGNG
jgi:hypothetical protein